MKKTVSSMLQRLSAGQRVVLCSILESDGSTPRQAGAKMAVFADGTSTGTVGGGKLEQLAALHAAELLQEGRSETKHYYLHPNRTEDIGMVCGGEALLGFQCFFPERETDLAVLTKLNALLDTCCNAWLQTVFSENGEASLTVIEKEDIHSEEARLPSEPLLEEKENRLILTEPVVKKYMTYIFGGGHVCSALVPCLSAVGFPVTVYDARPEFAEKSRFPQAANVICGSFEDIFSHVELQPEDYVVVMTPGHKADFEVLNQVLKSDATYIGCIGSRKKVAYINGCLEQNGYTPEQIARIHSPIGLPILAQTPEEIAVSITAELIYHRHGGR